MMTRNLDVERYMSRC